jgi:alcohol dehydrogenase class IV
VGAVRDDFTWIDGERLIRFGEGALADAPALLSRRGFDGYALLTTERALNDTPLLAENAAVVLYIQPGAVPEAAAAVRSDVKGRPLVAFGGGRVLDSGKAIAGADGLPCAAVPTTLSGAELTRIHRMPAGVDEFTLVRPSLVIAEPGLMASAPLTELAASAMNSLGHAAEALYTPLANPVTDIAALEAAALIAAGLEPEEPDRPKLALGALLGGYALGATSLAVHHVLSQSLVRVAGTPHAQTNAVVLPHALRLMADRAPEALGRLALALGADTDEPAGAATCAAALSARSGVTTLAEIGAERSKLDEVVETAVARQELGNTPNPPDARELMELLLRAYGV